MKIIKKLALLGILLFPSSCTQKNMNYYKESVPLADVKEYFTGPIKAWGIVQDFRGRVVRKFDIEMEGKWDGDTGTLTEHFKYYDGKEQTRVWHIKRTSKKSYEGSAADILGVAKGDVEGNAIYWSYVMDLPVGEKSYRIQFDDWMWTMNDGVLINRSYLKKFGFTVAQLTIFMQKQK